MKIIKVLMIALVALFTFEGAKASVIAKTNIDAQDHRQVRKTVIIKHHRVRHPRHRKVVVVRHPRHRVIVHR